MTIVNDTSNSKGGRPMGSSRIAVLDNISKIAIATENIAILYQAERILNGGSLKHGRFKVIHDDVTRKIGPSNTTIKQRTILSCISLFVDQCNNRTAPLLQIESLILQIALWKQDAGQPITPVEGVELAISSLIGSPSKTN